MLTLSRSSPHISVRSLKYSSVVADLACIRGNRKRRHNSRARSQQLYVTTNNLCMLLRIIKEPNRERHLGCKEQSTVLDQEQQDQSTRCGWKKLWLHCPRFSVLHVRQPHSKAALCPALSLPLRYRKQQYVNLDEYNDSFECRAGENLEDWVSDLSHRFPNSSFAPIFFSISRIWTTSI